MERKEKEPASIQVLKKGEPSLIPFRDPESLTRFMEQPLPTIAAAVTGALASGYSDGVLIGGRLAQAALRGKLHQQVGREIKALIEKGKIKENYADSKYGFKSLVELLEFIDSEIPDEDRLRAVKAMFVAVNAVDAKEEEELINYQLLQISKALSGSQLLVLRAAYDLHKEGILRSENTCAAKLWFEMVASRVGHNISALVQKDESLLLNLGLITERLYSAKTEIATRDGRLTDLGIRLCEVLVKYGDEGTRTSDGQ